MTTRPSNAARAAAMLCCTSGIETCEAALAIYDRLETAETEDQMNEILAKENFWVWEGLERASSTDYWYEVTMMAASIDRCIEEFKEELK